MQSFWVCLLIVFPFRERIYLILWSKFLREKMFSLIFGGKLFLRIPGKIAKIVKIRTRKKFVPHGISIWTFFYFVDSLSLYLRKTIKKIVPLVGKSFSASEIFFNRVQCRWAVVRAAHRVKLSKLNQTGSTWTEFLSKETFFFLTLLSVVFLYTANRSDENKLIQFFELW